MKKALLAAAIAFLAGPALGADSMTMMNKDDMQWGDAPPSLPKGAKMAVLQGDPAKPGIFTVRVRTPANYRIPPHWHSTDESLTVLTGTLYFGAGDKMEHGKAHAIKPGGFHHVPAKSHHYVFTKGAVLFQVTAQGPFDVNWINPDDDPAKMAAAGAKGKM